MNREFEAIVIGLGGIGSGAVYWLSRQLGSRVLGLEQFDLGHDRGGSQDHSRIIRYSYHTPEYVRLAAGAYDAWATVEEESGEELVVQCGGLDFFPAGGIFPMEDYSGSLEAAGVEFERLAADRVRQRWPIIHIDDSVQTLYQPNGGLVKAAAGNAAHQRLARERGATLLEQVEIRGIRSVAGEHEVETSAGVFRTRRLVIAAGAWTNLALELLGNWLPLRISREQVVYYDTKRPAAFDPSRFPIWIWNDEPCFYGFPSHVDGVKVAQDLGGYETTVQTRSFDPDPENLSRVNTCVASLFGDSLGPVRSIKTCVYTLTPDRDFIVDAVPGVADCWIAVGAGHAFKFASHLGRILSELALEGDTPSNLTPFRIDRAALRG